MTLTQECKAVQPRIWNYSNGTLTPDERKDIEAHLVTCQACREKIRSVREVQGVMQQAFGPDTISPDFGRKVGNAVGRASLPGQRIASASALRPALRQTYDDAEPEPIAE